ncbi:T9SS type A sorting domain-containing protein [Flavobacterium franklandianum]|uniref:T9SS type A sorting domain-containing protein n=1 Tax=Flavobacterium franklandianum TaxID=2594430 RepID=UPI00117AA5A6|nr:T9SS type A sorting domain-containing protein [Flavobacterium franklandianum]TRX29609.1 T9SS type A sorting domain-containing protein [Flavobacterium franklandianum]
MKTKLHYLIIALLFVFSMIAQVTGPVTITGTGTGGWNQPGGLTLTTTDSGTTWTASNFEIVGDGAMKFSEGGTWATTGGFTGANVAPFGFPSGTLTIDGGNDIKGTPGFWNVTYNAITKAYSFTAGVNPNPVIKISGGGLAADVRLNSANGIAYSKKSMYFSGGVGKFIEDGTANQWGGAFPDDAAAVLGGTITVDAGPYNVYFTKNAATPKEYVFEPVVVSIIGNFAGSNWGADLDLTTVDNMHYTLDNWMPVIGSNTDTSLHFKIRDNHDWATQYGESTGTNGGNNLALTGTAKNGIAGGGGDIYIPWGKTYNVDFNRATGEWVFSEVLGVNKFVAKNFSVYPNPTQNSWKFASANSDITSISIVDVLGKTIMSKNTSSREVSVDASGLSKGMYLAKVTSGDSVQTLKVVKN